MNTLLLTLALLLPQDAAIAKAQKTLAEKPDDQAANLVMGVHYASRYDWNNAVPCFLKTKDVLLRTAAEKESKDDGNKFTAVEIGDAWLNAAPKARTARQACIDRASYWYLKGWPMLEVPWQETLRKKLDRLYAPLSGGRGGAIPAGWGGSADTKVKVEVAGTKVHSGWGAVRITPPAKPGLREVLSSGQVAVQGKELELTAWMLSDGTDSIGDKVNFTVVDAQGKNILTKEIQIPADTPIWSRLTETLTLPPGAARAKVMVLVSSTKGAVYVDDVSIKVDGKEMLPSGSFEGK